MTPYPLRFRPLLKHILWGGRRLGDLLGKDLGPESDYAESWEIVDHGEDQSVVTNGNLAGKTLAELVRDDPEWLLGAGRTEDAFPLLLKYLDCNRVLSVQVHPDDRYARAMSPPDLGKTEAWYIVDSEPESLVYAGLREGVGREELATAIREGRTAETLHSFHPEPGDCLFIPAGTVHALGAGLLVAEIQQSSDTTFRLYDWDRVDPQGRRRQLHIEQALEVTDYESGPVQPIHARGDEGWRTLVTCDKFVLRELASLAGTPAGEPLGGEGRCHLLTVPRGTARLHDESAPRDGEATLDLRTGESLLLPAAHPGVRIEVSPGSTLLAMHLP